MMNALRTIRVIIETILELDLPIISQIEIIHNVPIIPSTIHNGKRGYVLPANSNPQLQYLCIIYHKRIQQKNTNIHLSNLNDKSNHFASILRACSITGAMSKYWYWASLPPKRTSCSSEANRLYCSAKTLFRASFTG